jgi:hypothetical protein
MSKRFKNISRPGWFIVGVIVAILLVPSVAVAAGLKFTGIEGSPSGNKADVASNGQLLTTNAPPGSLFGTPQAEFGDLAATTYGPIYKPPSGDAAIVTQVTVSPDELQDGSTGYIAFLFYIGDSACDTYTSLYEHNVIEYDQMTTDEISLPTGFVVPAGDQLCGHTYSGDDSDAFASASGYDVPSGDVAAPLSKAVPAMQAVPSAVQAHIGG